MATDNLQVLFDLNIILDVLQERKDFYDFSARLLAYAETGAIQGWLAAHSITTLFYLIAKDKSPEQARVTLTSLLQFLKIAPVDQNTIEQALNLPYRDFEDAVQMMAALQIHADYLLTRNVARLPTSADGSCSAGRVAGDSETLTGQSNGSFASRKAPVIPDGIWRHPGSGIFTPWGLSVCELNKQAPIAQSLL